MCLKNNGITCIACISLHFPPNFQKKLYLRDTCQYVYESYSFSLMPSVV